MSANQKVGKNAAWAHHCGFPAACGVAGKTLASLGPNSLVQPVINYNIGYIQKGTEIACRDRWMGVQLGKCER